MHPKILWKCTTDFEAEEIEKAEETSTTATVLLIHQ